jgi:putative copper export protein
VETTRLFLHVLAATVWVGGQLVLAAAVPALRSVHADAPRAAARAYNRIAWPAFAVLILTGIWNVAAEGARDSGYRRTLAVKLVLVAVSGLAAFLHTRATTARARGLYGAAAALSAVIVLLLGIVLAG